MIFRGYSLTFSTKDEQQYSSIGEFWDRMASKYGIENLRGLGYNWTKDTIEYVIGLKSNEEFCTQLDDGKMLWKEISLPDTGWMKYQGKTEELGMLYSEIYRDGNLTYEIEEFNLDGSCVISITRDL